MDKPKHSKGPWQSGGCVVWQTDGDMICDLSRTRRLPDAIEANARLISASPELLGACHKALNTLILATNVGRLDSPKGRPGPLYERTISTLRAAIRKATEGETK